MGLLCALLLLAATASPAFPGAAAGSHSLRYNLTVRSQYGGVQLRFFAEGRLDDQPILEYDSGENRAKPQGLWAGTVLGAKTWDTETQDLKEHGKKLRTTLADINTWQKQRGDSHFLQETWGCEIGDDNSTRGFWDFHYDGEPFLSYCLETDSWMVPPSSAQTLAMEVKKEWDRDGSRSKTYGFHVHGELCKRLQRYLSSWRDFEDRRASPAVNVTCNESSEGNVNVTCWALGFYPRNISLTWFQGGQPLSRDTQQSRGILPHGNGTFQTWVTTRIPQGEEQNFRCHMGHSGNLSTYSVPCGKASVSQSPRIIIPIVAASAVFVIGVICVLHKLRRRTPAAQGSGFPASTRGPCGDHELIGVGLIITASGGTKKLVSLQVQDQQQPAPKDHNGTGQLGPTFRTDPVGHFCPEELEPSCDKEELEGDIKGGDRNDGFSWW